MYFRLEYLFHCLLTVFLGKNENVLFCHSFFTQKRLKQETSVRGCGYKINGIPSYFYLNKTSNFSFFSSSLLVIVCFFAS